VALVAEAEQTLDLQYYIWEPDSAGTLMAVKLSQAAKRGVRVRVLIDDFTTSGHDMSLALLNSLRTSRYGLFNPTEVAARAACRCWATSHGSITACTTRP